jgi:hypothetical protein
MLFTVTFPLYFFIKQRLIMRRCMQCRAMEVSQ